MSAEIILHPAVKGYCEECIYHGDSGECKNEEYKKNTYKVNCVWKYCKYKKKGIGEHDKKR